MTTNPTFESEFVGRSTEIEQIKQYILSDKICAVGVHGIGGIGKTWLLLQAFTELSEDCHVALCDLNANATQDYLFLLSVIRSQLPTEHFKAYDNQIAMLRSKLTDLYKDFLELQSDIIVNVRNNVFQGDVGDIVAVKFENTNISIPKSELERVYYEMRGKITDAFVDCLFTLSSEKPVFILIDGYEKLEDVVADVRTPVAQWLEEELLFKVTRSAHNILFALARREELTWQRRNRIWRTFLRTINLGTFTISEMSKYFSAREITAEDRQILQIYHYTHGHPQSVALVVDLMIELQEQEPVPTIDEIMLQHRAKFDETLVSQFLMDKILYYMPKNVADLISQLSIFRAFNASIVSHLTEYSDEEAIRFIERVCRYSFVRTLETSLYVYHDVIREFLRTRVRRQNIAQYRKLHRMAHNYYIAQAEIEASSSIVNEARELALYHLFPIDEPSAILQLDETFELYENMYHRDNSEQLLNLITELPLELRRSHYWLRFFKARIAERHNIWPKVKEIYEDLLNNTQGDNLLKAKVLSSLGRASWLLDHKYEAISAYQQAVAIYRELGMIDEVGWTLRDLAKVHRKHGSLDEALNYCEQCRVIFEQSGDKYKMGWILKTQGEVYKQRAEYNLASKALEESFVIWRELNFEYGTVDTLSALADVQRFSGQLSQAKVSYNEALKLYKKHEDMHGIGWSMHGLGEVLRMQGDLKGAIQYTSASLEQFKSMKYEFGMAWNIRGMGELSRMQRNFEDATNYFNQARELFDLCSDPQGKAWTEYGLIETLIDQCHFDSITENAFDDITNQLVNISDVYMQARVMRGRAKFCINRGLQEQAKLYIEQAADIFRKIGNEYQEALCVLTAYEAGIIRGSLMQTSETLSKVADVFRKQENNDYLARIIRVHDLYKEDL